MKKKTRYKPPRNHKQITITPVYEWAIKTGTLRGTNNLLPFNLRIHLIFNYDKMRSDHFSFVFQLLWTPRTQRKSQDDWKTGLP